MKKIVPDPPLIQIDHCLDIELERVRERLANHPDSPTLLDSLGSTTARPASAFFAVRPGISAEEALLQASLLLKGAQEICDEVTELGSGVERGLIGALVHGVEMARAIVDALLDESPKHDYSHANAT
ncbi:hypothetical protein NPS46_02845 [Pseudomonas putida]|uniref:hypothetical protein n=1 Tax=Pseudomonas putida TaxID=303 RepID=UPI002363658F|nr:hypothetical protein [Pseudomonas putida]MDD2051484.1 hypothetical protein [Pseudomonas putida]